MSTHISSNNLCNIYWFPRVCVYDVRFDWVIDTRPRPAKYKFKINTHTHPSFVNIENLFKASGDQWLSSSHAYANKVLESKSKTTEPNFSWSAGDFFRSFTFVWVSPNRNIFRIHRRETGFTNWVKTITISAVQRIQITSGSIYHISFIWRIARTRFECRIRLIVEYFFHLCKSIRIRDYDFRVNR